MATDMSGISWRGMGVPGAPAVLMDGRWNSLVKNARDDAEPEPEPEVQEEGEQVEGSE